MIIGHGMVAFRDRTVSVRWCWASAILAMAVPSIWSFLESVALDTLGFEFLRDVAPRRSGVYHRKRLLFDRQCAENPVSNPCLFEYVYLRVRTSSTKFPFTAPASIWAMKLARKLPASGKIRYRCGHSHSETSCDIAPKSPVSSTSQNVSGAC